VAIQMLERNLASWPGLRGRALRYVLLRHTLTPQNSHYDLMLELRPGRGSSARTLWGLQRPDLPQRRSGKVRWKTHGMHGRRYLTLEGYIGNGRGAVERVDRGHYVVRLGGGRLTLAITGTVLCGRFSLKRAARGVLMWVRLPEADDIAAARVQKAAMGERDHGKIS